MKRIGSIYFIGLMILTAVPAISQVSLVLRGSDFGRTWAIRKGKTLSVMHYLSGNDFLQPSLEGKLAGMTDSSLTLYNENLTRDTTILFTDITGVGIRQTTAGKIFSFTFITAGVLTVCASPAAGFVESGQPGFQTGSFLTALGAGLVMTAIGALSALPYLERYKVKGACHTSNGRFLYNGNGTYFFSMGTGMGASYGGMGFRFQARFGRLMGIGMHVGVGWVFPYLSDSDTINIIGNPVSVLTGIKFFPYKGLYLDVQFGNFGRIADVSWQDGRQIVANARTPYGLVFSSGWDCFISRSFGLNLGAGVALDLTAPKTSNTFPVFDIGFIFKL